MPGLRLSIEDDVVDRYLTDTLRPDEIEQANALFSEPRRVRVLGWLKEWAERDVEAQAPNPSQTLGQLWEQIDDHERSGRQTLRSRHPRSGGEARHNTQRFSRAFHAPRSVWRSLAAIGLALGLGVIGYHVVTPTLAPTTRTYATASGERTTVVVAHGTRITLAPMTTLTVTEDVARQGTTVTVRGEALFQVVHVAQTPVVVQTRSAVARVIGTEFTVRQRDDERVAQVMVVSGRVAVQAVRAVHISAVATPSSANACRTLTAGMVGVIADSGVLSVTPNVPVDDYAGWAHGRLVFRGTPARDVIAEVGRAYGVGLSIPDSALSEHPLHWSVMSDRQALPEVLDELVTMLNAHYTRVGQTITIVPGRSTSQAPARRNSTWTSEAHYGK